LNELKRIGTIGGLKRSGYEVLSVKDEIRRNLIQKLKNKADIFLDIVGYGKTVIPAMINAILAKHDLIFLGLRGQAKTKMARMLITLLDDFVPVIKGSEINDNPFRPISKYAVDTVNEHGDDTEIEWITPEQRYGEKLATPDVTIADLIGDIDPIKAATQKLHYSHEGVIHFGIIPRTNRGVFVINELPDLQPRIQVGLLNIMQEKDIQIRGFNIRIPLDIFIVFTANPEDYTNRGNIITPLKDRIDSQILTHYPKTLEDGIKITEAESWVKRHSGMELIIPHYIKEIIETTAREARTSEFVEQRSGVSARMPITVLENVISNAERRAIINDEHFIFPRITDIQAALPGMTGKIELVFEGEQEGSVKVSKALIGKAVREVFLKYFPDPLKRKSVSGDETEKQKDVYDDILKWFGEGNTVEITDDMSFKRYSNSLCRVAGLEAIVKKYVKNIQNQYELATMMEFVLDGLHNNSKIAKEETEDNISYKDLVGTMLKKTGTYGNKKTTYDFEDDWN
jgi:magnesium chelatase subunit I